ncbi:protein FAM91A1-like isoform X2 [Homarus americanus]|uniref:protein FAM91A1-like isoform X2 n=1 Tax=Homarus americanus TaxID=6706 RepID=UPI001C47B27C|nr:protein FAM91A1-like isoform X2 [Homarus americanus]
MASEIETYIAQNCTWDKLPTNVKQLLGNSQKEYEKQVAEYSIKTQQRYRGNLVRQIVKNERNYYEEVLAYSRSHLMMYPYHLSDVVVKGLRVTPFQYYISILTDIMTAEKSYDSLPNFTAADCLRLLGIGRNQYIDLMNQCRSSRKLFRKKNVRDLLPALPSEITIEPWWLVCVGCVTEEDIKSLVKEREKVVIDSLIDVGSQKAGDLDRECVHSLYTKGLVYLDVPMSDSDCISVPPLEGFVMNRVLGDYLESLMYKIFVSIDEHTPVIELAKVLEIDLALVKVAVSLFCRLGFAHKKNAEISTLEMHPSWESAMAPTTKKLPTTADDLLLLELESALAETSLGENDDVGACTPRTPTDDPLAAGFAFGGQTKRIAFLYDSTLTAFLMMGNLSQGLKSHAVTMFEVGKMLDEGLDSLLTELDKIQRSDSEGEAQRYFEHALTLRTSVTFLRHNRDLCSPGQDVPHALDLIRWESLSNLDPATTARLLKKNYQFLVSMAPLSYEISAIEGETPPHFGPAIPEVNSIWFKLFIYHITSSGPPSLLLPQGERLRRLPECLVGYEKVLVTPWGHDPTVVPLAALFTTVNEALMHSPVFIQAYGWYHDVCIQHIPFPLESSKIVNHPAVQMLAKQLDLQHTFGFIKLVAFPSADTPGVTTLTAAEITTGMPQGSSSTPHKSFITNPSAISNSITECSKVASDGTSDSVASCNSTGNSDGIDADSSGASIPQVVSFDDVSSIVLDKMENSDARSVRENMTLQLGGPSMDQWHLLECHFGLPLFDASLNQQVSHKIISHKLFSQESVEKFSDSNRILIRKLREFISGNKAQGVCPEVQQRGGCREGASNLPLPTTPLLFADGTLSPWEGS